MMRRILALILAVVMLFSMVACYQPTPDAGDNGGNDSSGGNQTQTPPSGGDQTETPPSAETETMTQALAEYKEMITDLSKFPVNFVYNGVYHSGFDAFEEINREAWEDGKTEGVSIWVLMDETMIARLDATYYHGYEAYDYTVYFENYSETENSGVLEHLNAVDMTFSGKNARLKGILGDHDNQYLPYDYDLSAQNVNFTSLAGRATHVYFPYFNLETDDGGALLAIGWGGTWQADFVYDAASESTHYVGTGTVGLATYLKPGETVRTPLIATVRYYERDEDAAMNRWRDWMIDCNLPSESADSDEPLDPFTSVFIANDSGKPNSDGSISQSYDNWQPSLDAYYSHGLTADYNWVDAGWYYSPYNETVPSDWWGTVGTWEMDPVKWPGDSFLQMTQYTDEHGTKTFLWFEPERVTHLDGMVANYGYKREWVLSDHGNNNYYLNNLGNKDCFKWTLNRIITTMDKHGIDMYREDFNMDPGHFWTIGDGYEGENRVGITENLYMQGHYALWDGIIDYCAANGKTTFVDSCASGGGRNDLETLRRAVPLLRSDSDRTTIELRLAMTTRLVRWIPFTGAASKESANQLTTGGMDIYVLRASYLPHIYFSAEFYHKQDSLDWDTLLQGQQEWEEIQQYFYADFYVLTPYRSTTESKEWTVWEYFDEETDSGVIQAFRLPNCDEDTYMVQLKGIDPDKYYTIKDIDGINSFTKVKGSALLKGIPIYAENPRTAIILYIEACE